MSPYEMSEAFKRLEKIAELEKIVNGEISDLKDGNNGEYIPDSIREDLRLRGGCPVPKQVLDDAIDDGLDSTIAHLSRHRAMLTPGEALYHAIGNKDFDTYEAARRMSLSDILSMITNKVAVSQTQPDKPMHIDDFDEPRHIRIIVRMRGISPDLLEKSAKDRIGTMEMLDGLQLTYMTGRKETVGRDYVKSHKQTIGKLIDDGIIIKIIKVMSSGMKTTVYNKTASSDVEDMLYLEMLHGSSLS